MTLIGLGTDVVLILIGLAAAVNGWRRGALVGIASLAGLVAGFGIGNLLLPHLQRLVSERGWQLADHPVLLSAAVLLGSALIVQSVGYAVASAIRRRMGDGVVHGVDSVGGMLVSVGTVAVVIWLVAGLVRVTPFGPAKQAVADSTVVSTIDTIAPMPSSRPLDSVATYLDRHGFPRVFSGQPEQVRPVDPPNDRIPSAVRAESGSVVRVTTTSTTCGRGSEGSGWVTRGGRVVTNAHVVAGADRIAVQERGVGVGHQARLIAFDPGRDVAVLQVPGLDTAALPLADPLEHGDQAVVAGFPGNGPYTVTPARVRQPVTARGLDIYDDRPTTRDIYALRAEVRPGNSGGPLFTEDGEVAGMVFARSTSDADTGYALTLDEVRPVLRQAHGGEVVDSGRCI